jgi:hypothetical protein
VTTTGGALSAKSGSSDSRTDLRSLALEVSGLALLGVLAVAFHALTRGRFELGPGHQGITWMAVVMVGRLTSGLRWAGITTAAGAAGATLLPFWGRLGDPFMWVSYVAAGAIVDVGFAALLRSSRAVWLVAMLGGVAHASKPFIRSIVQAGGWQYESLLAGVWFPASTHFLFGAAGAVIGAAFARVRGRNRTRTSGLVP